MADDDSSCRKNRHHKIAKSVIKEMPIDRKQRKVIAHDIIKLRVDLHAAYHCLFNNGSSWDAASTLKEWRRQILNGNNGEPMFFTTFSPARRSAFILLFGFEPKDLSVNGNFYQAVGVVNGPMFRPGPETMEIYIQVQHSQPKIISARH